jgi:uncharacterized phage-associated protein
MVCTEGIFGAVWAVEREKFGKNRQKFVRNGWTSENQADRTMLLEVPLNKSIQVTAYLLNLAEGRMHFLRLLKLLYLINREALKEDTNLIIYDVACALPKGPILSTVYDLLKKHTNQTPLKLKWKQHIKTGKFDVHLVKDPGDGELSSFDKRIIESVFTAHKNKTDSDLIEFTHGLPEWRKHKLDLESTESKDSYPIKLKEIAKAVADEMGNDSIVFWKSVKGHVDEVKFFAKHK